MKGQECGVSPLPLHHHQHVLYLSLAVDDHFHLMDIGTCGTHPRTTTAGAPIIIILTPSHDSEEVDNLEKV